MPISHMHYSLLGFGFGCMHVEGKRVRIKHKHTKFADIQEHIMYQFVFMGGDLITIQKMFLESATRNVDVILVYQYTATYCLVTDFFLFLLSHCCGQSNKVVHSIIHSCAAPTNGARASPPSNGPLVVLEKDKILLSLKEKEADAKSIANLEYALFEVAGLEKKLDDVTKNFN
ncbi:hypothetical protein ACJX0J_020894, partial [Zea mays]